MIMKTFARISGYLAAAAVTAALLFAALPCGAVTQKEMDEARAITAKAYLRYANNGSGYLDEIEVRSMADLTSHLKEKEKENLKAFNKVAVPSDYASWDKEKLVEFWSVTFFKSPELSAQGKAAKTRVRAKLQAMTVSAPAAPEPAPEPAAEPVAEETAAPATEVPAEPQEILADQKDIEAAAQEAEMPRESGSAGTWIYVVVLVILVGVVIWLMLYASKLMKKQSDDGDGNAEDTAELRDKARAALVRKNEEIENLKRRLAETEERAADTGAELEKLKLDNRRLYEQIERLRAESRRQPEPRREPAYEPEPLRTSAPVAPRAEEPVAEPAGTRQVLYLGRVNSRGLFVRADRRVSPGNTVFRLDTQDGLVGTFRVVDEPDVTAALLANPNAYLAGGCIGEDLEDTAGVRHIVTEGAGTAILEKNGYWKVLRKTTIRYE